MIQPIPTVAPRRRTPLWLWVMLALLALSVLAVMTAFQWVFSLGHLPARIVIDGTEVITLDPAFFTGWNLAGLFIAMVLAVFCVLVIVPIVLLITLACALIGIVLGVALPLIAVVLALAVALSPFWLLGWFVWWLVKRSTPAPAHAA